MIGDSENSTLENIKDKIQVILNRSFKERYRQKIDFYSNRWNFACPCCGDSSTDIRKKRGNLFLDSLSYHCYNCGEHMGINSFLNRFDESLSNEDKIAVHELQQNSKKFERRTSQQQSSMSMSILERVAIPKSILFKSLGVVTPYKNEFASDYLKSRMIDIKLWKYFAYKPNTKELYILNITPSDRVIGYQIRQLDPNSKKARYITKSLTKMYDDIFKRDISGIVEKLLLKEELGEKYINEEDGIENIVFNLDKLSGMFNIMNINLSQTITVMEGPIDSLAISNSIALQGASKKLNGFFDEVENVRYIFDNDMTGKEMSIKKLKDHKNVFLWNMYLKKIHSDIKIKDINDLQKNNMLNMELIDKCFSDDELDVIMI